MFAIARLMIPASLVLVGGLYLYASSPGPSQLGASPPPGTATPPPGRIAFQRLDASGNSRTYTMDVDGSGESLLLPGVHEMPRWSPDGTSIVVTTIASDGRVVPAVVAADGSGLRELPVEAPLNLGCGAWSADGRWLYCEGWADDDPEMTGTRRLRASDGGDMTRLSDVHDVPNAELDDGQRLIVVRVQQTGSGEEGALWMMDADGTNQRQLIDRVVGLRVSLAPDERTIIADGMDGRLFTVDVHDGTITDIHTPGLAFDADWSPDGEWLVFAMYDTQVEQPRPDLYVMRRDGSGLVQITDTPGLTEGAPAWAPR
jgi:Tol biopolymer transport system component